MLVSFFIGNFVPILNITAIRINVKIKFVPILTKMSHSVKVFIQQRRIRSGAYEKKERY